MRVVPARLCGAKLSLPGRHTAGPGFGGPPPPISRVGARCARRRAGLDLHSLPVCYLMEPYGPALGRKSLICNDMYHK
jgi:hypothetical protein